MFEFIDKIKDKYRQNRVEKLLNVQKSLSEIDNRIEEISKSKVNFETTVKSDPLLFINSYISELAQLKLNKNKLLKSEQSLKNEDPLFKSMYDHMRFEATYKEVTKGYRQGQINLDRCDEILKAINNDKKVKYSDNLIFNTEGKLLLLKRSELDKTFPGMYTIPGGHVDAGEDHRTAAIRELQEESGLTPDKDSQFTKVGEYEDDKVCIEYFLSYVDNDSDTLCLQSEEAWQYEWIESKELDKYEFPLNMKQNIQKILFPYKEIIRKIGKAYKSGKITKEKFVQALDVLNKSVAQIGETRHWSDGDYKKVSNGEWVKVVGDKEKPIAASGITKKIKEEINLLSSKFEAERRQFNSNLLKETSYREDSIQYKVLFQRKWYEELENNSFLQKIKQDQKDLNEEILEIQKQLEVDKKSEREKIAGKKEIDFDDLNDSLKQLHKLFTDIKSKVKVFLTADKVAPTVTVNSYFLDTEASFKPVVEYEPKQGENGYIDNVAIEWNKMKESGKYEHTYSPKSSSEYLIDREKGDVYRMADHWGRCASCYWSNLWEGSYGIGVCNVKDFKRKDSGNWLNPEYRDKIVEASEISLNELKGLVNRNDIYFTEKAKEGIKSFTKNIFDNELKSSAALSEDQIKEFKEKYTDLFEDRLGKSFSHKYISKKPDGKGGWEYEYEDEKKEEESWRKFTQTVKNVMKITAEMNGLKDFVPTDEQIEFYAKKMEEDYNQLGITKEDEDSVYEDNIKGVDLSYSDFNQERLDESEKVALDKYHNHYFEAINTYLRTGDNISGDIKVYNNLINKIDSAISKNSFDSEGYVYRIIDNEDNWFNFDQDSIYQEKGYSSTTTDIDYLEDQKDNFEKPLILKIKINKGQHFTKTEVSKNVQHFESEILLPRDQKYKVVNKKGGEIELEAVNNFDKSLQSINELYLQNRISDELYETIIEKAWNKSPIGTITTRSNGQKWKKVSETGNKDQDWQLVGKPKTGNKTDEPVSKEKRAEYGTKGEQPTISEHAKESSETALNNAIKESQDPEVREAAHQELDRRQKEEHVQEEPEKKDDGEKKEEKTDIEKFKESVNKEFKKATEDLSNFEDWSDNKKLHDLSTRQKYISTFLQKVNNVSSEKLEEKQNKLKKYLNFDGDLKAVFGDGKILALEVQGDPKKVFSALCVMEDGFTARMFKPDSKEIMMHEFYLNPSIKTGKGKGTEIFSNQVEQFKKLGYEKLTTDAEKGDIFNGYYTWAVEGYQMSKEEERADFNNLVRTLKDEKLNKVKSLEELVSTKEGREYWRKEGFKFTGEFDMRDNSQSMKTLNNYKNERSSRDNK